LIVRVETAENEKKNIINNIIRDKVTKETKKKPTRIATTYFLIFSQNFKKNIE